MHPTKVIVKQLVTEKASIAQNGGQYGFIVNRDATKLDVKRAIEELYSVQAEKVTTSVTATKTRMLKGKYEWAKRKPYKKAFVTLKKGQTLDPNKFKFNNKKDK